MDNIIKIELITGEIIETIWSYKFNIETIVEELQENKFFQYEPSKYINTDQIVKFEVY